ncbi:MAG: Maf family protein [Candidatus Eisenbacteria bacterium]
MTTEGESFIRTPRARVVLASESPRRRELLRMIGIRFEAVVPRVKEELAGEMEPSAVVVELALKKALAAKDQFPDAVVIGADTLVVLDGKVLGKPVDATEAYSMLRTLSGRTHTVYTGTALVDCPTGLCESGFERSLVTMRDLSDDEIARYIATGEPMDKAGGYGIQGFGGVFITHINGCYFNVMGLPIARLYDQMDRLSKRLLRA